MPAELPGSTPNDLADSEHVNKSTSSLVRNSYRRSSQRRAYFERTTRSLAAHTTASDPSIQANSSFPKQNQLQMHPLENVGAPRRSFDQFPSVALTTPDMCRTSLDSARPYSHPGRSRGVTLPGIIPRTSIDIIAPLPTVDEKTVERNDSTTSTTAVVTVPQVARRYHPNHVYIRRQPGKHRSLPSELPHVQSQSLLTDDLADWMTPPSAQSEKLKSTEWSTTSGLSSPSMSVASCPAVAQASSDTLTNDTSLTGKQHEEDSNIMPGPMSAITPEEEPDNSQDSDDKAQESNEISSPNSIRSGIVDQDSAASIRSHSSSIIRKPVPATARLHPSISVTTLATASDASSPPDENATLPVVSPSNSTSRPLLSSITSSVDDAELSILQKRMLSQSYVETSDASTPIEVADKVTTQASPEPTTLTAETPSPKPEEKEVVPQAPSPSVSTKPMSAQAKRRAAHQRRMELAFGGSP